jgi:hypothetical protein
VFGDFHRTVVHLDSSVLKHEGEPWYTGFFVVSGNGFPLDHCTEGAEQKKMDLQGEAVELKEKVLAPAENIFNDLSLKATLFDRRVAGRAEDHLSLKRFELFFREK